MSVRFSSPAVFVQVRVKVQDQRWGGGGGGQRQFDSFLRKRLDTTMRFCAALWAIFLFTIALVNGADEYRQLTRVEQLPLALDRDFEIRKAKLFFLGDTPGPQIRSGRGVRGDALQRGVARDPAVNFESSYRLFGAVTALDQRRRHGHYFDFFWRAKRPAAIKVRLEYRQEKLRTFTQAREVSYRNARGSHRTSFAVIGDEFWNDGRVLSWRCLLLENGRIVAEERSFLWR
ncbi:MAG: hypothetical protein M3Q89_14990 [Verrucomicrobiota bacterium]|nr:hypothetical protein [Verrucomicrobiota bacterium]